MIEWFRKRYKKQEEFNKRTARCDSRVFADGKIIALLGSVHSEVMEAWCRRIAQESGQKVDWSFSGGRAVVKALGDLEMVDKCAYWGFDEGLLQGLGGAKSGAGYFPGGYNHWSR